MIAILVSSMIISQWHSSDFWQKNVPDQYGYLNRFGWVLEYLISVYAMCGLFWLIPKLFGLLVGCKWKDEA